MTGDLGESIGPARDADLQRHESPAETALAGSDPGRATSPVPVDAPGEPAVRATSTITLWLLVLAAPATWVVHFLAVYLTAEASCVALRSTRMSFIGDTQLRVVVAAATAVAMAAIAATGWRCRRRAAVDGASPFYRVGLLLAVLSGLATFVVGVPSLVLDPC